MHQTPQVVSTKRKYNVMVFKKICYAASASLLLFSIAQSALAQDLIASQAPIERKQKAVDSLTITRLVEREIIETPSTDLYSSWNTKKIFCYSDNEVPETYKIDLRGFAMPTPSRIVTSRVGYRPRFKRMHKGLDIKVYTGDTIYAAFDGKVRMRDFQPKGFGNVVVLRHNNGLETIYGHLSKHLVQVGQTVKAGQPIGLGGNTGASYGSHLHFETRLVGALIDPEELFDFPNQDIKADYYVFHKYGRGEKGAKTDERFNTPERTREQVLYATSAPSTNTDNTLQGKNYQVKAGETVASIARRLDISVDQLCSINHISRNTRVRPGQILRY